MNNETPMGTKKLTHDKITNRVAWVKALLSGEYRQGTWQLRIIDKDHPDPKKNSSWCCLGVAGHVLDPYHRYITTDIDATLMPPKWFERYLGFSTKPAGSGSADSVKLAIWNDTNRLTFFEIADRIALATDKRQRFSNVDLFPPEIGSRPAGTYAREWVERMEASDVQPTGE